MDNQDFKLLLKDAFRPTPDTPADEWQAIRAKLRRQDVSRHRSSGRLMQGPTAALIYFGLGLACLLATVLWLPATSNQDYAVQEGLSQSSVSQGAAKAGSMLDLSDDMNRDYDQSLAAAVSLVDASM